MDKLQKKIILNINILYIFFFNQSKIVILFCSDCSTPLYKEY